ncbi:hypothetical protein HYQ46_012882 [Verticillium longisporum]|nr:hypothetical protein HYQ44_008543 [Verticillium longisporum]KAG7151342.1 hypothetical protein HYQ46_012882 [Verticillium longisporum]
MRVHLEENQPKGNKPANEPAPPSDPDTTPEPRGGTTSMDDIQGESETIQLNLSYRFLYSVPNLNSPEGLRLKLLTLSMEQILYKSFQLLSGMNLIGQRPLPRVVDDKGVDTGAKGYQYDWTQQQQLLWNEVARIREWSGKPSIRIEKSVITLRAGHGIQTPAGKMSMVVPIDRKVTQVAFRSANGDVFEEWRLGLGYQLQEQVWIGGSSEDTTFILIKFSK